MEFLLSFLLMQAPVAPTKPVREPATVNNVLQYYAGCEADLNKANEYAAKQDEYIKYLESQVEALKPKKPASDDKKGGQ